MNSPTKRRVVAIDGPAGSGKSSTSRGVAERLGFDYLDTGAMYRAMTWAMLNRGIDVHDPQAVADAASAVRIWVGTDPAGHEVVTDGEDVTAPIRSAEVTAAVSPVSAVPRVRELLVAQQREVIAAAPHGIVVEGRDIGTTVAPDAPVKVFLVADPVARAARRAKELGVADTAAMEESLARRDAIDSGRTASPLAKADDAVTVDGTHLTLEQVIDEIVALVNSASIDR